MTILLIPGFWLTAESWAPVEARLAASGFDVRALTLPGKAPGESAEGIGLAHHIAAVVAAIDHVPPTEGVILVGHSGGGAIASGAADARPDRVARVIYVDSGPLADGFAINDQLPEVDGGVPLPDWSVFDDSELADLDESTLTQFRLRAVVEPFGVVRDPIVLTDERRFDIPTTVISTSISLAQLQQLIDEGSPFVGELTRMRDVELRELPTGHWPQFSKPVELAEHIAAAAGEPRE